MAFTVTDFQDFLQLLDEHPKWRVQLRQILLNGDGRSFSDSLDRLTEQVRLLTEQVRILTERMDRLEQRVYEHDRRFDEHDRRFDEHDRRFNQLEQRVEEGFKQINERIDKLEQRTDERFKQVHERIDKLEQRVEEGFKQVDERFNRVEQRLDNLEKDVAWLKNEFSEIRGERLHAKYQQRIGSYWGKSLLRVKVVEVNSLEDDERISEEAYNELLRLDLLAKGKVKHHPDRPEVWLAIEISTMVNVEDVTRARQRADLLCEVGYPTLAVAWGQECSHAAAALAQQAKVIVMQDGGTMTGWDEALAALFPATS